MALAFTLLALLLTGCRKTEPKGSSTGGCAAEGGTGDTDKGVEKPNRSLREALLLLAMLLLLAKGSAAMKSKPDAAGATATSELKLLNEENPALPLLVLLLLFAEDVKLLKGSVLALMKSKELGAPEAAGGIGRPAPLACAPKPVGVKGEEEGVSSKASNSRPVVLLLLGALTLSGWATGSAELLNPLLNGSATWLLLGLGVEAPLPEWKSSKRDTSAAKGSAGGLAIFPGDAGPTACAGALVTGLTQLVGALTAAEVL